MARWIKTEECDEVLCAQCYAGRCLAMRDEDPEGKPIGEVGPDGFPAWCPGIDLLQIITDPENQPHQFSRQEESVMFYFEFLRLLGILGDASDSDAGDADIDPGYFRTISEVYTVSEEGIFTTYSGDAFRELQALKDAAPDLPKGWRIFGWR